jgi:pimeloyl-ACP methyl ester carboxylesterase
MIKTPILLSILASLLSGRVEAQDVAGQWQGTLKAGSQELRVILEIIQAEGGRWTAAMYPIDQGPDGMEVSSVTLDGFDFRFTVESLQGIYQGKLSRDGAVIVGTWRQERGRTAPGTTLPLELLRATKETAWPIPPQHKIQFVGVDKGVKLEVFDWGGSGRPLVLLAGLGGTAHVFDGFAPKLTDMYHVYGITRRGFGRSSVPATGYSADRLGDDVLGVIDALKLNKPVLVGHSIAGEELSSVGSRYPERVAGLIYLDAGYSYAYYDQSHGGIDTDVADLKRRLDRFQGAATIDKKTIQELLETLPVFERALRERQSDIEVMPASMLASQASAQVPPSALAVLAGEQKYTSIPVPVLAIFAVPHDLGPMPGIDPAARAAFEAHDEATTGAQAKAFEDGVPTARVVRLPHANHNVYTSNEADVLREMNSFLARLP